MSTNTVGIGNDKDPQVDLPPLVATWVLGVHGLAILMPLTLLIVVEQQAEMVAARADYPDLFSLAVLLMMLGSAFEMMQNHADRWYVTPESASAGGQSSADMLFYSFVTLSQAVIIIACAGQTAWLSVPALLLALSQPFFYYSGRFVMLPLAAIGILSGAVAYNTFGDPVILLQLGMPAVTVFFFGILLKTGNQFMHGLTTLAASFGVVLLAWGIQRSGTLVLDGWLVVVAIIIGMLVLMLGTRRFLLSLKATPRPSR
jgi:hypothetical protein